MENIKIDLDKNWNFFIEELSDDYSKKVTGYTEFTNGLELLVEKRYGKSYIDMIKSAKFVGYLCGDKEILRIKIKDSDQSRFFWESVFLYSHILKKYFKYINSVCIETYFSSVIRL